MCALSQVWSDYEEPVEVQVVEESERKTQYKTVGITEVTPHLRLYCQVLDASAKLDQLTEKVSRQIGPVLNDHVTA